MSMPPPAGKPASILARVAEAPPGTLVGEQVFQRLLRHRIVFLGQQVDDELANRICAELVLLAAEDARRDISLYINSPGGSVSAGMAASMGQFLLCAGTAGKRYALPHAQILMHQPSGGIGGTASDIRIHVEQLLALKRTLAQRIALHTGQTVDQIEADSDRDRWFTADEAKDYGFVDQVVRSAVEVASEGPVS